MGHIQALHLIDITPARTRGPAFILPPPIPREPAANGPRVFERRTPALSNEEAELPFTRSFVTDDPRLPLRRVGMLIGSIVVHTILLTIVILVPMWFTNALNIRGYTTTMLLAPPPPAAAPVPYRAAPMTAARKTMPPKTLSATPNELLLPRAIPREVATIRDAPTEVDAGGVIGGVPGGIPGEALGALLGGTVEPAAPPPVIPQPAAIAGPKEPLRVGGNVRAARAISKAAPNYPPLARQARIQGTW
jgi:periplasmic protein TonB